MPKYKLVRDPQTGGSGENVFRHLGTDYIETLISQGTSLGKGSYGSVTRITHNRVSYIVKKIIYHTEIEKNNIGREISILKHLKNDCTEYILCYVTDILDEDQRVWYIITDDVRGISLDNYLKNMDDSTKEDIVRNMIEGLTLLHQKSIIHRDIKPENIIVYSYNKIKYIDFGISCFQCPNTIMGTPYFMAPEVYKGNGASEKSDVWSLGVTIYMLLSNGIRPFEAASMVVLKNKVLKTKPAKITNDLFIKYMPLMGLMLTKSPDRRISSEKAREIFNSIYFDQRVDQTLDSVGEPVIEEVDVQPVEQETAPELNKVQVASLLAEAAEEVAEENRRRQEEDARRAARLLSSSADEVEKDYHRKQMEQTHIQNEWNISGRRWEWDTEEPSIVAEEHRRRYRRTSESRRDSSTQEPSLAQYARLRGVSRRLRNRDDSDRDRDEGRDRRHRRHRRHRSSSRSRRSDEAQADRQVEERKERLEEKQKEERNRMFQKVSDAGINERYSKRKESEEKRARWKAYQQQVRQQQKEADDKWYRQIERAEEKKRRAEEYSKKGDYYGFYESK